MLRTEVLETMVSMVKSTSLSDLVEFAIEFSEIMQDFSWLLFFVMSIVACLIAIASFCNKTHGVTINTISELQKNKKYIPKIFVELNEGKETLRYFIFGKKWKKRIIKEFNFIYHNYYGDILRKAVKEKERVFFLKFYTKFTDLISIIRNKQELHNALKQGNYEFESNYAESQVLFGINYHTYNQALSKLEKYTQSAMSRYLILTGSAGNGKTNLLCSISELIMSLKQPVIFINAREIKDNPEKYILERLHSPKLIVEHSKLYWKFENFLLGLRQKFLYIIIDAVNENEVEDFAKELSLYINEVLRYSRFKVIVSCRNEYYQSCFRADLVDNVTIPAFELDIKEEPYNDAALERIFLEYKEYFNFNGYISPAVKEVLKDQLLMLRVFFETYENKDIDVLSICKHEVFKKYIEKVSLSSSVDTDRLLRNIARIMIDNNMYDGIPVSAIECSTLYLDDVKKTIDDSILIGKKLIKNEGTIAEVKNEVIYFVFDEMRDYVLAREIITDNIDVLGNINSEKIINDIHKLKNIGSSALEGIMHYTYVLFRTEKNIVNSGKSDELCSKILDLVRIPDERERQYYYRSRHRVEFMNLGLRIILSSGLPLTEVEKDYIRDCLIKDPYEDGGLIFDVMLKGTILGATNNLDTYLDILFGIHDKNSLKKAFLTIKVRNDFDNYYVPKNLENIHKDLLMKNKLAAEQVQKIAELFLICFVLNDPDEQLSLENYFKGLPDHQVVHNRMLDRIKSTLNEVH